MSEKGSTGETFASASEGPAHQDAIHPDRRADLFRHFPGRCPPFALRFGDPFSCLRTEDARLGRLAGGLRRNMPAEYLFELPAFGE